MNSSQQLVKVLVVEDDEDDFLLISAYFKDIKVWRFEIKWVQRYAEALDELCINNYTICFCDYSLGAKNGIDFIKDGKIKNILTPVILLTGKGNYHIDIEATKAGAFDYLIKADLDADKLELYGIPWSAYIACRLSRKTNAVTAVFLKNPKTLFLFQQLIPPSPILIMPLLIYWILVSGIARAGR
jgi:CheY-like chemotaxis protein